MDAKRLMAAGGWSVVRPAGDVRTHGPPTDFAPLAKLTVRQRQVYDWIAGYIRVKGYSPTVSEIGAAIGTPWKNAVRDHLKALVRRGVIRRARGIVRGIALVEDLERHRRAGVPVVDRVGTEPLPGDADAAPERLSLDAFAASDAFAVRVRGDALTGVHVLDGDVAVIARKETARDGQVVAVRDGDGGVSLRVFRRETRGVRLEYAAAGLPAEFRPRVEILGVLAGLVRTC